MIGKLLGGRYQVVGILGSGGFSQTYIAEDTHRPGNPNCVVKHLKPASSNSSFLQSARRLFRSEAETLEKLGNHDQIPRLLAYFEEDQEFFLVQEFVKGHALSSELQPGQTWSETQVCEILHEVLGILEFVHSNGVIHRDIKPNNLIKRHLDGRVVLVDFGSVKQAWTQVITELGQTNATFGTNISVTIGIGTPGYMPTEQGRGRPRPNSDIYALGILGIQALTGLNPMHFEEDINTGEILWQHQAQVSDAIASVLTKMVRYHFKDRFQTAAEALHALEPIVNSHLSPELNDLPVQSTTPQRQVFLPQFSQEPLPDPTITSVAVTNRSEIPVTEASLEAAVFPSPSYLPNAKSFSTTAAAPQEEPIASSSNQNVTLEAETANSLGEVIPKYPAIPTIHHKLRIGAGITAVLVSLVAGYVLYWQPRPSISTTLERIENLKAAGKYEECMSQAPTIPRHSFFYTDAQTILFECQLAQAKTLAADRKFYAAIAEASHIPQGATLYQDAQQLIDQWSDSILKIADNTYRLGKLNDAIAIAEAIPETSLVYQKSQRAIKQWNGEWEKNNSYLKVAQKELDAGQWQNAITEAKKVIDTPYWQEKIKPITQKAEAKITAAKPVVTRQRRVIKKSTVSTTRPVTRTISRPIVRTATRTSTRPPRPVAAKTRTRPPRPVAAKTRTRPPRPVATRTRTRPPRPVATRTRTRPTPRPITRSTPPKPSYTWTTKTVP